ncbi:hypothetical protein WICPIJ_008392 [Wickerhamomyces pijperi]|uniref:Double-strand break repair protein n=1 Tax=Wickerhamomyces pijperi TaxID=599730 RepID=A0A9P8TII5_WICPI|nr:hypothetical protein WICPIJ_008392 [Wickerhamomyces pijperi]
MPQIAIDPSQSATFDPTNTIRILITTDNHLGHNEAHPHLSKDSQTTFREILSIASTQSPGIDFILQGGDLFDISKPSKQTLWQTIKSLRDYIHGGGNDDRVCELELLSDPEDTLTSGIANFEDPNMNITLPIFAISGNHDESSGLGLLSPLDLLSAMGLINRMGHVMTEDDITVRPVLLQKGSTKVALYGLGNVRDERLRRSFEEGKVKFLRPENYEEYFNLLAVHQNHVAHAETVAHLPENYLPSFMDFVLWGHEHECVDEPVHNQEMGFDVLQAGSSVATSLSQSETKTKYVFVLTLTGGGDYHIEKIPLRTVRPFVMKDIKLAEVKELQTDSSKSAVNEYLISLVESLIKQAEDQYVSANLETFQDIEDPDERQSLIPLPLIRLRVDYTGGFEVENPRRFSNRFVGKVANVDNVVQLHLKKISGANVNKSRKLTKMNEEDQDPEPIQEQVSIQSYIQDYLKNSQTTLTLLPELGLSTAVRRMIEMEDKTQISQYVEYEMKLQVQQFMELSKDQDQNDNDAFEKGFKEVLKGVKEQRLRDVIKGSYVQSTVSAADSNAKTSSKKSNTTDSDQEMDDDYAEPKTRKPATTAKRGRGGSVRGRGRGRGGSTATTSRGRKPAAKSVEILDSDEESDQDVNYADSDDDLEEVTQAAARSRGNTSANKPRTTKRTMAAQPVVKSYVISDDDEVQGSEEDSEIQEIRNSRPSSTRGRPRGSGSNVRGGTKGRAARGRGGATSITDLISSQSQSVTSKISSLLNQRRDKRS